MKFFLLDRRDSVANVDAVKVLFFCSCVILRNVIIIVVIVIPI